MIWRPTESILIDVHIANQSYHEWSRSVGVTYSRHREDEDMECGCKAHTNYCLSSREVKGAVVNSKVFTDLLTKAGSII